MPINLFLERSIPKPILDKINPNGGVIAVGSIRHAIQTSTIVPASERANLTSITYSLETGNILYIDFDQIVKDPVTLIHFIALAHEISYSGIQPIIQMTNGLLRALYPEDINRVHQELQRLLGLQVENNVQAPTSAESTVDYIQQWRQSTTSFRQLSICIESSPFDEQTRRLWNSVVYKSKRLLLEVYKRLSEKRLASLGVIDFKQLEQALFTGVYIEEFHSMLTAMYSQESKTLEKLVILFPEQRLDMYAKS